MTFVADSGNALAASMAAVKSHNTTTDSGVSGIIPPSGFPKLTRFHRYYEPKINILLTTASCCIGAAPGSSSRETFLNYFFGAGVEERKSLGGGELSMGMPFSGAFEMKSLAKAVDAPPTSTFLPTPPTSTRTDFETTLIRSLVSSSFSLYAKRSKILFRRLL
ncbi:hypothetical protein V5O48_010376 [Marasmius crinis-equi]|uniref:Uncharacterized protein n=1 Tax=Marasmius crinis-equi TaxID=585013 RepID=A0ABR3F8N8_9AGAR